MMAIAGTWTASQIVGQNLLFNGFYLMVVVCGLSITCYAVYKGKVLLESVVKMDKIIIAVCAVMIVLKVFLPDFSLPWLKNTCGKKAEVTTPATTLASPYQGYSTGKYFISLSSGEESEEIFFQQGKKYTYSVNTDLCSSDSLMMVYSTGDTVKVWDNSTYNKMPSRHVRFKLVALAPMDSVQLTVRYN
jgi:hypothetical protein